MFVIALDDVLFLIILMNFYFYHDLFYYHFSFIFPHNFVNSRHVWFVDFVGLQFFSKTKMLDPLFDNIMYIPSIYRVKSKWHCRQWMQFVDNHKIQFNFTSIDLSWSILLEMWSREHCHCHANIDRTDVREIIRCIDHVFVVRSILCLKQGTLSFSCKYWQDRC